VLWPLSHTIAPTSRDSICIPGRACSWFISYKSAVSYTFSAEIVLIWNDRFCTFRVVFVLRHHLTHRTINSQSNHIILFSKLLIPDVFRMCRNGFICNSKSNFEDNFSNNAIWVFAKSICSRSSLVARWDKILFYVYCFLVAQQSTHWWYFPQNPIDAYQYLFLWIGKWYKFFLLFEKHTILSDCIFLVLIGVEL
jgi:hypothetical protein